jgi:hypothetical protein
MSFKEAFLKKGWAGRTISREETAARINPLLKQHRELNHYYNYVLTHGSDANVAAALGDLQKTARMDVGKLAETVFSNGGTAYNGTDLEPENFALAAGDDAMLFALLDLEKDFLETLKAEHDVEHQMRTRAILGVVEANSQARSTFLKQETRLRRRPPR